MTRLRELLQAGPLLLDGGMGTMLLPLLQPGQCPETLSLSHPGQVAAVHRQYAEAGARAVYTNTFGANRRKLTHADGLSVEAAVSGAVAAAREGAGSEVLVALDLGPIGELVEPMGSLTFEEAYDLFSQQVKAGVAQTDLAVIESMADLYEVKAALLAVREHSDLPLICTMSFESNLRTYTGCHVDCMAVTLEALGADAIGINCSLGPVQLLPIAQRLSSQMNNPLVVKPNAGLPVARDGITGYDIDSDQFAAAMGDFITQTGAQIIGGCCGTTPEYISKTARFIAGLTPAHRPPVDNSRRICTASNLVMLSDELELGRVTLSGDPDTDLDAAMEALCDGAQVLQIELGGVTASDAVASVKAIQASVNLPMIFAGGSAEVLEAALRVYNGRPGVERACADAHPTLCAKYGAAAVS